MEQKQFLDAVARYQDMVYRIALHQTGNASDGEDAIQEVFLRLLTSKKPPQGEEHIRRWLIRVTGNYCRDLLKSPWRKRRVSLETLPEEPVFQREEEAELYREVMKLPEKYRTVLDLFYYEELSVREIAEVLEIKESLVTTRLSRARSRLREHLREVWQDDE